MWMPKTARSKYVAIPWNELPTWLSVQFPKFAELASHVGEPIKVSPSLNPDKSTSPYGLTCWEEFPLFVGEKGICNTHFTKQLWNGHFQIETTTGENWWTKRKIEEETGLFLGMYLVFSNDIQIVRARKNSCSFVRHDRRKVYFDWADFPIVLKLMTEQGLLYFKQMVSGYWLSRFYEDHLLEGIENEETLRTFGTRSYSPEPFWWLSFDFPVNSGT